jgi:CRISPR-associated protein Cas5
MDLSFFLEPPEGNRTASGKLVVEALKPLSMTTAQPGTYYRSQPAPTEAMLYGMLENALGWHFPEDVRKGILKELRKAAKKKLPRGDDLKKTPWITGDEDEASGAGFQSLLQHHLRFPDSEPHFEPATVHFDDLWARQKRRRDSFVGGSRHHDSRVGFLLKAIGSGRASWASTKNEADVLTAEDVLKLDGVESGTKVHENAVRPFFPQYYVSPTPREYVIPSRPYQYRAEATPAVADLVAEALRDPAAPLYLGTNDGWVDARWETIHD